MQSDGLNLSAGSVGAPVAGAPARTRALQASLILIGLMWSVPFLIPAKAPPIPSFHAEILAAALGLLALSALPLCVGRLTFPRVALLPLGFFALIVLQVAFGQLAFNQVGVLAALYCLWATGLCALAGTLRRELGDVHVAVTLSWFLLAGALVSALIAWLQHIDSDALGHLVMQRSPNRVWANLGQPNQLADYLVLGLASVAFLCAIGKIPLRWAVASVLALAYVLGLTASRTAWAYLAGLVALSGIFWSLDRSQVNRRLLALSSLALVSCVLLPWFETDVQTAASRLSSGELSSELRLRIWKSALLMFSESPLSGVGVRQFGWHHFLLNGQMPEPRMLGFTDHAHNLILHVLAEFGLMGFVLLMVFVVMWIGGLVRQPRTAACWWVAALMGVLTIHSMLEYPLWYTFFLGIAAVLLGLGEPQAIKVNLIQRTRTARLVLVALLAAGWLMTLRIFGDYLLLENFLAFRYRYIHASAEVNRQARNALREVQPGSLLAQYVELGLARTISVDPDHLAEKLAVNGRAMLQFPIDDVTYRHAMLLALDGDQVGARRQWDLAIASFPSLRDSATLVLKRRVEDGLVELQPLLDYAQQSVSVPHNPVARGVN